MGLWLPRRARPEPAKVAELAAKAMRDPKVLDSLDKSYRHDVEQLHKALHNAHAQIRATQTRSPHPVSARVLAQQAAASLQPSSSITPVDIEAALHAVGMDMVAPFSPGTPLVPYYGYGRRPRVYDYEIARNTTTETRPDHVPFRTLLHLWKSYDVAQACTRYSINDLRSMSIRVTAIDGWDTNPVKEIAAAKAFLRKPDGIRFFGNWLAQNQRNLWIFDSAPIFRLRDKAGRLKKLVNVSAMTLAVMVDYFGDVPTEPNAPAFQQFIQGVPWDWLTLDDIIYQPFWPETDSPYGTPPLETVLINANTDLRLQLYFLDFFTAGAVPEAIATAPEGMTDPDSIAELEETYAAWTEGDQRERWGLRWLPAGTELNFYKPDHFDPDLAEYVMRRTVAAFGLTPQNLGILDDVNRATSETQTDQQFRVSTLPIVRYYEDLLNSVLQDDLSLPVQVSFDTGREKEDRLNEAKAWYIWWQMGAVSPDEAREKVLGLPVDALHPVPRVLDSQRLGPVPLTYVQEITGPTSQLTFAPQQTPQWREFVVPGSPGPDPLADANNQDESANPQAGPPKAPAPGPGRSRDPNSAAKHDASTEGLRFDQETDPAETDEEGEPGLLFIAQGSTAQGTAALIDLDEAGDLRRWRANARKAVARGRTPRRFESESIRPAIAERVWKHLQGATTRAEVDEAFRKGRPEAAGILVQAADTGRVLMVRRSPDKHDPGEAYARWEFPGGMYDESDPSPWTAGLREFHEETGATLPAGAVHLGNWTSADGSYVGYVVGVPTEASLRLHPDGEEISEAGWWSVADLGRPEVRDKVKDGLDRVLPLLKAQLRDHRGRWATPELRIYHEIHRNTDRIIDFYVPLIAQAMAEIHSPHLLQLVVAEAYYDPNAQEALKALGDRWKSLLRFAALHLDGLRRVLRRLYGDAWFQGARGAAKAANGSMPPWTISLRVELGDRWEPNGDQIADLAQGSLARLLSQAEDWVAEIANTQSDRIAAVIGEAVRSGFPLVETLRKVNEIVHDEGRARMIAETEVARAMTAAARETYRANGVQLIQWIAQPGACPRCVQNLEASPRPLGAGWPNGDVPVHPLCRCVEAPYYGSNPHTTIQGHR